jgi:hypothetical protein
MSTITTRAGKGSPLTNNEVDANFTNLNTDKAELSGAAFTGAITTTSTVDGRDVATDGSKLDGIEASADVTDTANVTAAGALMDSELTAIASVKALNQGVATTDSPTFAGLTTSADINFGDNDKAVFGAGSDLQIYHTGTDSRLVDSGTGTFYIAGTDLVFLDGTLAERYADFTFGGAARLYYDNAVKLATTSTGIDVTGTATMDGLSLDNAQYINFKNSSNVSTRSLGINGANTFYIGGIDADIGDILFVDGGTTRASFANGGDISFYEDTGTTPKFFWDASAESLGIGTSSIAAGTKLQVAGETRIYPDSGTGVLRFGSGGAEKGKLSVDTSSNMMFETGGAERMRIDSSGQVKVGTTGPTWDSTFRSFVTKGGFLASQSTSYNYLGGQAYYDGAFKRLNANAAELYEQSFGNHIFYNAISGAADSTITWNERMRIDSSGNLLVGTTSQGYGLFSSSRVTLGDGDARDGFCVGGLNANFSAYTVQANNNSGTRYFAYIANGSSAPVGTISFTSTATAYNTSSDQRLKENIADADDAGSKIDAIQVRKFDWKVDGSHQDYGMIAQELQTVAPEAVSTPENPDEMMGVDYSKLVPMLIKEIQSLRNRVAQLEE